jgi:outer membrane lipase/esterase
MTLARRELLLGLAAAGVLLRPSAGGAAVPASGRFNTLRVFGDSYSIRTWPFDTWSVQILPIVPFRYLRGFAVSGSTAADGTGRRTLAQQITSWQGSSDRIRADDVTVVYFGHNDVDLGIDLARSRTGLATGLDRLISAGVTSNGGLIVVPLIQDWGATPLKRAAGQSTVMRQRTLAWNEIVRDEVARRSRVLTVDLFALLDPIVASPAAFGLTNVTTPDAAASATSALWYDTAHPGARGQAFIAAAIAAQLLAP